MATKAAVTKAAPKPVDLKSRIGSLASQLTQAQPGEKVIKLPLDQVIPNPKQHRKHFDKTKLIELGNSIKNSRQELPVIVRPNPDGPAPYILISGERRWRACGLVGVKTVDAIVRQISAEDEAQILLSEAAENWQREGLQLSEEVGLALDLVKLVGIEQAVLKSGKSKARLSKLCNLGKAPPVVAEAIALGLSDDVETLYQLGLLAKDDEAKAVRLVQKWKGDDESREHMRRQIDKARNPDRGESDAPALQNPVDAPKASTASSGESSAIHTGEGGDESPTLPDVRSADTAVSSDRPAGGQRSEPSTKKSPAPSTTASAPGEASEAGASPVLVVTGAAYEGSVVILKTATGSIRFDRASLSEVLGLDG